MSYVIRRIMNLIKPKSEKIEIFGERLTGFSYNVLKKIGSTIKYPVFFDQLSGRKNLELH